MFRSPVDSAPGFKPEENFDLQLWRTAAGYRARVRDPESGEAHTDFVLPFPAEDLTGIFPAGTCRDVKRPREAAVRARDLCGSLFDAIFSKDVLVAWRRRLEKAGRKGLRLRLHLNSPELWDWPWELLYDPLREFLSSHPSTPVVRYIEMPEPVQPLRVRPPIRVLAVSACPEGFSALSAQEELADLESALSELRDLGRVELDSLENATREALRQRLQEKIFHVL